LCGTSSPNKGFTLIEILIALVLLGILSGALYASYFTVVRAREKAAEGMESRRELGTTLDLLRREIASAAFFRDDKRLFLVVEDRDNFGKPASALELTTQPTAWGSERRESGIIAVSYRLVEKDKQLRLTRSERDVLYDASEEKPYPQMERISSFLVECYDGSKWVKSWNTSINGTLPKMLRITVTIEENGKLQEFSVLSAPKVTAQ
jgi:general secretion pathway protein J